MSRHADIENEIETLITYMQRVGNAEGTIKQRVGRLRALGVPPSEATPHDVAASLPASARKSTRRVYLAALNAAFRDLVTLGICTTNPTLPIHVPNAGRGEPRPLSQAVVDALLSAPPCPERDWTILGIYAGFRASDVVAAYAEDLVETDHGLAVQVEGKGEKRALLPAHPKVVEVFTGKRTRGPLWRMQAASMSSRWSAWAKTRTGLTLRYHQCRHTFGTRVYRSTQDILVTRDLMRHNSVATTQIYAKANDDAGFRAVVGL